MSNQPDLDPLVDRQPSRYVVGIDLGTTNSAVAYVDALEEPWQVRLLPIPQLVAAGQIEARPTLPSFHYQPTAAELASAAAGGPLGVAGADHAVGLHARDQGALTPGRLIASAKSWLCHSGVDRTAEILPWQGAADVDRLSPVEVSARYLRHLRDAWNEAFPEAPLAEQQVVITLPASFDEVARELTVRAAADAQLSRVVLIEEPQAAFYAWVYQHADDWETRVSPGQTILVCDIGGGTADFTLIRAGRNHASDRPTASTASSSDHSTTFHRVAVGNHLILGGDNLDLTLARHVERRLAGDDQLPSHQWDVLVRQARQAKETLLGENPPAQLTLSLPGTGSRVIGGSLQATLSRTEVEQLLVESFLPRVALGEKPSRRQSGFQEFGLPYAADPAITRYLAAFLTAHAGPSDLPPNPGGPAAVRPELVLFNGGFFASPVLRQRLLEVLSAWFATDDAPWAPRVLDHAALDLAVAYGAAYYGMTQRGAGVRIAANLARSYYIGVAAERSGEAPKAVCVIPGDAETGREFELTDLPLQVRLAEPVEFPLYVSSTRLTDRPGEVVDVDPEQTTPLPPIRTVLHASRKNRRDATPVVLHTRLSEIGTIELWLSEIGSARTWRLQFDVRAATQTDMTAHEGIGEQQGFVEEAVWQACQELIAGVFAEGSRDDPAGLMKRLSHAVGAERNAWPPSLLRRMWDALMEFEAGRRRSAAHEARWLNLLGFALRPGFGVALDDWRVDQTWRTVRGKLTHRSAVQSLILWRRVAGGLSRGQQTAIADPGLAAVRALHRRFTGGKQRTVEAHHNPADSVEVWRLLGSLELLPAPVKIEVGETIVQLLPKRKLQKVRDAMVWTLGRLGQRVPVYGPLNSVVPDEYAAKWLTALMEQEAGGTIEPLAVMQLARQTGDRHRDLAAEHREQAAHWIASHGGREHLVELVRTWGRLDAEEQGEIFGESLPSGLRFAWQDAS